MKVLMVGWEFPPHISGGLGTACEGIARGLGHQGVEVTFVVPHLFGDESTPPGVRLVHPPEARAGAAPAHTAVSTSPAVHVTGGATAVRHAGGRATPELSVELAAELAGEGGPVGFLRVLGIDSPLRPYLDAAGYAEWVELTERSPGVETPWSLGALVADVPPVRALVDAAPTSPGATTQAARPPGPTAATEPPPAEPASATPTATPTASPVPSPLLPVSLGLTREGRYARDLFGEVARFTLAVGELAATEDFDLVHAHDWMTFPGAILAARRRGKPLVVHVHSCEYDRSGEGADRRIVELEQAGLDAADRVVCVSHYTSGVVTSRYRVDPSKIRVVHNAVTRRDQTEEWHLEKTIDEPIVLFLGRVTFQKGPDYFLQAAARVVREEPNVRFVLGGTGDMLPTMIEESARMRLQRHLSFTGFLSGVDVERMYALADIYVMPSVSEPFGIAPLEAMALDVPVIVSRQSGVAEVLEHALKVDFWDVEDIANKILALLRQPALRRQLVEDGREEVARMRWDLRGQLLREVYREVLGGREAA
jgi:glycosyltransferase involved in cell wall biosynthesis